MQRPLAYALAIAALVLPACGGGETNGQDATPDPRLNAGADAATPPASGDAGAIQTQSGPVDARGPAQPVVDPITVDLALSDGSKLHFDEATADNLESFVDPRGQFTQLCRAQRNGNWTVFFRPDAGSDRVEVVIELGKVIDAAGTNSASYTATIQRKGAQLAQVAVAKHFWWSRWRWQSAPRPVRATAEDLFALHAVPKLDAAIAGADAQKTTKTYTYAPMAFQEVGLTAGMGTTGERPDIGLITEWQAEYLATGNPLALTALLAQAEAHASVPVHMREATKITPVSIVDHPNASNYFNPGAVNADPDLRGDPTTPISPELAHYPSLDYVPYLLTGDPYFLEEQAFLADFTAIGHTPNYRGGAKAILESDQTRGYAWSIRNFFQLLKIYPDDVPGWLLPKSYFATILGNNLSAFAKDQVADTTNAMRQGCHFAIDLTTNHVAPWQQDFLATVFGWAVQAGFSDWTANYAWHIEEAVHRGGGSGLYPRSRAIIYYYKTGGVSDWDSLATVNALTATPTDNYPAGTDTSYIAYLRGALTLAQQNGIAGAGPAREYVVQQAQKQPYKVYRWAFAP